MSGAIFYYTGTGNSLWTARKIAENLKNPVSILSMIGTEKKTDPAGSDITGLVFPVYIWGIPAPVLKFVKNAANLKSDYIFAVAVNGGQVSNTLVQLKGSMAMNGLELSSGFEIKMPSNYIPWGGPGTKEHCQKLYESAEKKIKSIASAINNKEIRDVEKGPLWQRVVFSAIYRMTFSMVPGMDKNFWVNEKCNGCGICAKVCPAGNISIDESKPRWNHKCQQCYACLQWCPEQAMEYGKNTPKYERYHHPEIKLKDVIKTRSS
jgi:ferredoxin